MELKSTAIKNLKEILLRDYGVVLERQDLLEFAEVISKLTLIAKRNHLSKQDNHLP